MSKYFLTFVVSLCISSSTFAQQYGALKDTRDGKVYKTVKIGSQIWMAENLNTDRFRNGDLIPEAKTNEEWVKAGQNKKPAWCYALNNLKNGEKYGKLYNWYAVKDPRGLAPSGWRIPSVNGWIKLIEYLGGDTLAGEKMKSKSGWFEGGNGTNISAFSGLPSGYRNHSGAFKHIEYDAMWWSSTEESESSAWGCELRSNSRMAKSFYDNKKDGISVRCIKD